MESNAQLEKEKSALMSQAKTLQDRVQELIILLCETRKKCAEETMVSEKIFTLSSSFRNNVRFCDVHPA